METKLAPSEVLLGAIDQNPSGRDSSDLIEPEPSRSKGENMNNRTNLKTLIVASALAATMAVPSLASAQRGPQNQRWPVPPGQGRYDDRWDYRNDDRWDNRNDYRGVRDLVVKAERSSNQFREDFERRWGRYDDWRNRGRGDYQRNRGWTRDWDRNDAPREAIQRLDEAFERLRRDVDRNRDGRTNRAAREEMAAINRWSRSVDNFMRGSWGPGGSAGLDRQWSMLKRDIDQLNRYFGGSIRW